MSDIPPPSAEDPKGDDRDRPPPWHEPYGHPPGAPPPPGHGPPPGYGPPPGAGSPPGGGYPNQPPPGYEYAGFDPRYAYGPPGAPGGPRPYPSGDDTTWALMCYIGMLIVGFIAPLVIYFVKKKESSFVRFHAAQAMNYTITVGIWIFAPFFVIVPLAIALDQPLFLLLGAPIWIFHVFAQYVFLILGTVKASNGHFYRFPTWTCFPMIR